MRWKTWTCSKHHNAKRSGRRGFSNSIFSPASGAARADCSRRTRLDSNWKKLAFVKDWSQRSQYNNIPPLSLPSLPRNFCKRSLVCLETNWTNSCSPSLRGKTTRDFAKQTWGKSWRTQLRLGLREKKRTKYLPNSIRHEIFDMCGGEAVSLLNKDQSNQLWFS